MKSITYALLLLFALPFVFPVLAQQASKDDLVTLAKQFIDLLAKEDFAAAVKNYDETMTKVFPETKTRETWQTLNAQVGAFKRQIGTRTAKLGNFDIIFVTCEFERATLDAKVVFNEKKQIAGLGFVPVDQSKPATPAAEDQKPASIVERDVTVGTGEWALPGTLTLPKGDGKFAAVVLVHGSGPNDRDETIMENKPFRDLAWGLAERGIAVLRYDKRTKVHGKEIVALKGNFTVNEETVDDALLAVALLKKEPQINAKKIFVLGHSLGGMMAPRIGKRDAEIAGLIILAGLTRPLEDTIVEQITYISSVDGSISEEEQKRIDSLKQQVAKVKELTPDSKEFAMGVPAAYWLDLRGYYPPEVAKTLKQPMLILQGEKDYQVTMKDLENWKAALSSRKDVIFKSYPKLFHLFIETEDKPAPSNYDKAGHVAPYVIDDIANWIKKN
jgi:dienelactone hydrolase